MMRGFTAVVLGATFSAVAALAQAPYKANPIDQTRETAVTPDVDAYVYVSARVGNTSRTRVYGFAAEPSGELRQVAGSPVGADVTFLAVSGKYLFGSDATGAYIRAFDIAPDGKLKSAASTNVVRPGRACDNAGALFVDPAGGTVYNVGAYGKDCTEAAYQAFQVEKTTGRLELVQEAHSGMNPGLLRFSADHRYAFGAGCAESQPLIYGYVWHHDGSLARLQVKAPLPTSEGHQGWCPYMAVAAPGNRLLVPVRPASGSGQAAGFQLATYTIGEDGTLSTRSTPESMPRLAVGELTDVAIAPEGNLVAVSGTRGLEVFRLEAGVPVNALPGLLNRQEIDQMSWDGYGHLYAINQSDGKLWVFNVDENGWTPAPGSPYAVDGVQNIAVQPTQAQPKRDPLRDTERAAWDTPYPAP